MADFPILNTWAFYNIPLTLDGVDASGNPTSTPIPATDIVSAASSSASLAAVIRPDVAGNQQLSVTAMVALSDTTNGGGGIMVTLTDSNGDTSAVVGPFSVVGAPLVFAIHSAALASGTPEGTQAVPTASGP